MLRLRLTKLQHDLYVTIVRGLQGTPDEASNTRMWNWLRLFVLVCNHPQAFLKKLLEPTSSKASRSTKKGKHTVTDIEDTDEPDEIPLAAAGLSTESITKLKQMLKGTPKLEDPSLSVKAEMFLKILEHAKVRLQVSYVYRPSSVRTSYKTSSACCEFFILPA